MEKTVDAIGARELVLHAKNTERVYANIIGSAKRSLMRRLMNGTYDADKAAKFWVNVADYVAKEYAGEYGGQWRDMFNVETRREAASMLAVSFDDAIRGL